MCSIGRALGTILTQGASTVDDALRTQDTVNLQHLRRFVKTAFLPTDLRTLPEIRRADEATIEKEPQQDVDILHFLICAVPALSIEAVCLLISSVTHQSAALRTITVPINPPMSAEQAEQWSREYWPTIYKKTNPYGPHPSIVAHAEEEITTLVESYIGLARSAADAVAGVGKGQRIGAVVVDRSDKQNPTVVAVAGDARWNMSAAVKEFDNGIVTGHAVMRVIGLVARKRQELSKMSSQIPIEAVPPDAFADEPLTDVEYNIYKRDTLKPNGYLCLDLELYLTHEPCVMCSMAILHSRFSRVIFQERMPRTGGLTADVPGNGPEAPSGSKYALFWRPELNWKLLAWQWHHEKSSQSNPGLTDVHA